MNNLKTMSLDDILDSQEYQSYISPAWKSPQSRESMIVRKMRNNIVKKIPKTSRMRMSLCNISRKTTEVVKLVRKDVTEQTAQEVFDFDEEPSEVKQEAMKHDKETTPDTTIIEPEELAKEPVTSHEKITNQQTAFFDELTTNIASRNRRTWLLMIEINIQGSSSAGNNYLLADGNSSLMLEAGLKPKDIMKQGINFSNIQGLLVTHEHSDHSKVYQ